MIAGHTFTDTLSSTGSDKSTQTVTSPGPPSPAAPDPALFCNVLCNMLVDRIKDTLQEAMKTYSTDTVSLGFVGDVTLPFCHCQMLDFLKLACAFKPGF